MKKELKIKILLDVLLIGLLLLLMGYFLTGSLLHEWLGVIMFLTLIVHHYYNRYWYRSLKKVRSFYQIITMIVNGLLIICLLGLLFSGIVMSRHIFTFIDLSKFTSKARIIHLVCSYWGFVLMAIHLGLHGNMFRGILKTRNWSKRILLVCNVIACMLVILGIYYFFKHDILTYLLLQSEFVFFDFNQSMIMFILEYLIMMFAISYLSDRVIKLMRKR